MKLNFVGASLLATFLLFVAASATELTDLGSGLAYLRVHSLAESEAALRKVLPGSGALVLDLRYATASDESTPGLKSALASHPADTPLLILVSPATPAGIVAVLGSTSALTLGAPGSVPAPKVVVQTDAATDRRAYDALESGTPVATLISGKIEKERFDEATLVHEFKNGNPDAAPLPGNPAERGVSGTNTGPAAAGNGPLIDRVLQRAVHLHRALLALRR